jgi:hypothetical protein
VAGSVRTSSRRTRQRTKAEDAPITVWVADRRACQNEANANDCEQLALTTVRVGDGGERNPARVPR